MIDETHDPARTSWVSSANGHPDFPIQNLPFGIFSPPHGGARGGVAIGDAIFDIAMALENGLFTGLARDAAEAASGRTLNPLLEAGAPARRALRRRISELLEGTPADTHPAIATGLLHDAASCTLHLPARIGDYTDFFAGISHAMNGGKLNRPDNPLMPNYKYVPVAYHGRASSVRVSGGEIRRPNGQRKPGGQETPDFGPSRNLDYELELGIWVGEGNPLGEPIPMHRAASHIAGFCLLNDWSARDIQGWESAPLGPFLAKSFSTSVSPWMVTAEAMAPFRKPQPPRPAGDPRPLPHLWDDTDQAQGALDIALTALLRTPAMREAGQPAVALTQSNALDLYWTVAQMVAHHSSNGCNLRPGDLFGSGTISGIEPSSFGSLLEISQGGRQPVTLPNGEVRRFLEDGDEISFRARASAPGRVSIGFGECSGRIAPAHSLP